MSKDFIVKKVGGSSISLARKQQRQLSYFTKSSIQEDITVTYLEQWANRKYQGSDDFLNWVKTVFQTDNFLTFYKYLRFPVSSAKLINERVKTPLSRVFYAEDSFFNYTVGGERVETPENLKVNEFNEKMFNALLFRFNDILVHDLKDTNKPFRHLISIENVIALDSHDNTIERIAFSAVIEHEEKLVEGFLFIDSLQYVFYDGVTMTPLLTIPHDLGECPADYITKEAFADDDIVRNSIFSFVREELEEYTFLRTLQRMSDANGTIPITTQMKTKDTSGDDIKGSTPKQPMSSKNIGGQKSDYGDEISTSKSILQPGTIVKVKPPLKSDGSVDMDMVKNFLNFFHMPVEQLDFVNKRVKEVEQSLITSLVGDFAEGDEEAMNTLQVSKGFVSKEDKLRGVSLELSRIRKRSDTKMLGLEFGIDRISVDAFYGSDFFLETQQDLYNLFEKSPNPIERKNILIRLAKNRSRFNPKKAEREVLLNMLLPYSGDVDFDKAITRNIVTDQVFQYQTRFDYWIGVFEAQFGDIVEFFNMIEGTNAERIILINNLILGEINKSLVGIPPKEPIE